MRRYLILVALGSAVLFAGAESRIEHISFQSGALGAEKPYTVYLPDGYDASDRSYPVLYLLHGAWGNDRDWTEKGNMKEIADLAIASGTSTPMIVVMPDARGEGEDFGGKNMGYFSVPGWDYEKYFYDELIPDVERRYRAEGDKRHRAIAGLSMGGGGSAYYAQKYPEWWGSACSLSGALGYVPPLAGEDSDGGAFDRAMKLTDPLTYVSNAEGEDVDALKSVRWYVDCGDDDFLADGNVAFYQAMKKAGVPLQFRMRDGGHTWLYWQTSLPEVLRFVSIGFLE